MKPFQPPVDGSTYTVAACEDAAAPAIMATANS
jgi:hypothetical protein